VIADSVMRWLGAVARDVVALTIKTVPLAKYLAAVRMVETLFLKQKHHPSHQDANGSKES
jgi:hypothetical protein